MFQKFKLAEVAAVEQDLATGETADGDAPKNVEVSMIPLLDDPNVRYAFCVHNMLVIPCRIEDKVRLLMLYIIGKEGVRDEDRRKLLEHARISSDQTNSITNLALLGIKLSQNQKQKNRNKNRVKKNKKREDDVSYDLSRYVPNVKNITQDLAEGRLSKETFPFVRDPAQAGTYGSQNAGSSFKSSSNGNLTASASTSSTANATSLRSTKPSWHNRKGGSDVSPSMMAPDTTKSLMEERKKAGRLIIFVAGGMTYSELRSVYELGNALKKDIIIGKLIGR